MIVACVAMMMVRHGAMAGRVRVAAIRQPVEPMPHDAPHDIRKACREQVSAAAAMAQHGRPGRLRKSVALS